MANNGGSKEYIQWSLTCTNKTDRHDIAKILLKVAISWWSVSLVEETGEPRENHRPVASH